MSNNVISTWSPNDLILPTVEGLDYAMYYVTDAGKINGLNINFEIGDWLVYLKNKSNEGNWYKANNINVFNTQAGKTAPLPGFYTRVRLDNNANIISAEKTLNPEDIPPHTHTLSDIDTSSDDFKDLIKDTVSEMIAGTENDSVRLNYDPQTKTFSAETKIDDLTIGKDIDGQLYVKNAPSDGTGITFGGLEDITQKVEELEQGLLQLNSEIGSLNKKIDDKSIVVNTTSGLDAEVLSDGNTLLNVKFDNSSIVLNALGELSISPDFIVNPDGSLGSGNECANHDHTSDQISDFREAVLSILKENSAIDVSKIPIDNETIIVNSDGNLAAISAGIGPHEHLMKDVTDLDPNKADTWASDQSLQGDANIDFSQGLVNLTDQTVGSSIKLLNTTLKEVDTRLKETEKLAGSVVPAEPPHIENVELSLEYVNPQNVWNIPKNKKDVAGKGVIVTTGLVYPYNEGIISVVVDGEAVDNLLLDIPKNISNIEEIIVNVNSEKGSLKVIGIKDSYFNIKSFQGFYKSAIIQYTSPDGLNPGPHTISFTQQLPIGRKNGEPIYGEVIPCNNEVKVNIYGDYTPVFNNNMPIINAYNDFVSGIPVLRGENKLKGTLTIEENNDNFFIPLESLYYTCGSVKKAIQPKNIENGLLVYDFYEDIVDKVMVFNALSISGNKTSVTLNFGKSFFDNTEINENDYRYVQKEDFSETEFPVKLDFLRKYNSVEKVPKIELVIKNNMALFDNTNYSDIEGPDYSQQIDDRGFRWINFGFTTSFKSNIFMDIIDNEGNPFKMNKNGTLEDIQIFVGQSNTEKPQVWVNGNKPYEGWGKASGLDWAGLDLFKSDNIRRWVTFGQSPDISGNYIFVRIGLRKNKILNCKALLDSILESING